MFLTDNCIDSSTFIYQSLARRVQVEWEARYAEMEASSSEGLSHLRREHEAELRAYGNRSADEERTFFARLKEVEERAAAEVAAAERGREGAIAELSAQLEEARLSSHRAVLELKEAQLAAEGEVGRLREEREELSKKLKSTQAELLLASNHASSEKRKWESHSTSASEHEAVVAKLQQQLHSMEASYRQAPIPNRRPPLTSCTASVTESGLCGHLACDCAICLTLPSS